MSYTGAARGIKGPEPLRTLSAKGNYKRYAYSFRRDRDTVLILVLFLLLIVVLFYFS